MNFDRAAAVYDATRTLPPGVIERIMAVILSATRARPDAHILDIGVGTGRFTLPLLERGYSVTGIDISEQMMQHLRAKVEHDARLTLLLADAQALPLPDTSVDVVMAMQVLHLIPQWRTVLKEARRVLKQSGFLVVGSNQALPSPPTDIRRQWRLLVQDEGGKLPATYGVFERVRRAIIELTGQVPNEKVIQWTNGVAPLTILDAIRTHTFSDSWPLPDDVMDRVHHRLVPWAVGQYGNLERPLPATFGFVLALSAR